MASIGIPTETGRMVTRKASDLFVDALENEGVEYVFAVPGKENLDLLESLRKSSIRVVLTRHEQGAGFMAATYGRLTGRAGVCMATLGPGATNLVTPAAYAQLGAFPLVMITGQKPIKKSKQGRFQIVDVVRLMEPTTKSSKQIVHGNTIPSLVREAFRLAEEERPGACLLELPEDVAAEETDAPLIAPHPRLYAMASDDAITQAVWLIRNARHPLLMIGAGANRKDAREAIEDFVGACGIPFCATQMGKGVIDERNPLCLGTAALSDGDYIHCAIDRADLVINVGHDAVEKPPFLMEPGGKTVIHVNYRSARVDQVYFPQAELVGDLAASIRRLREATGPIKADLDYFMRVKAEIDLHLAEGTDDDRFPMIPQRLVADVRKVMGENDVIALDNGMYKIWFARNYPACRPNTVLLDNALATMGAGLPSAMAAAMLCPDRRVMAICGDGGFMMNSQELETAIRLGLDLVVLVLNDGSYGMIRWKQQQAGFPDWGLEFGNPDFVAYAQSYGAAACRIGRAAELVPALEHAFDAGGIHLIDLAVDYSENTRVLIDELQEKTCLLYPLSLPTPFDASVHLMVRKTGRMTRESVMDFNDLADRPVWEADVAPAGQVGRPALPCGGAMPISVRTAPYGPSPADAMRVRRERDNAPLGMRRPAMARMPVFNSPFLLGFDQLERALDRVSKASADGYPPYNIEQTGNEAMRITLAVAGFSREDLAITVDDSQLTVRGKQTEAGDRIYLHRGIAARQFQRSFVLAEGIEVVDAEMSNGLLHIDLVRPPAASRERVIEIRTDAGEATDNVRTLGVGSRAKASRRPE